MVILGCRPTGRNIEQHDVFFGIAPSLVDLIPDIVDFWPEANGKIHIDSWRKVENVDGFKIDILPLSDIPIKSVKSNRLFFINLGGYKVNDMEEYHYKMLTVADNKSQAIQTAKKTAFYKHCGYSGAVSHIDDKYGIDVDDFYTIEDILHPKYKEKFHIHISKNQHRKEDELHIGYLTLSKLRQGL